MCIRDRQRGARTCMHACMHAHGLCVHAVSMACARCEQVHVASMHRRKARGRRRGCIASASCAHLRRSQTRGRGPGKQPSASACSAATGPSIDAGRSSAAAPALRHEVESSSASIASTGPASRSSTRSGRLELVSASRRRGSTALRDAVARLGSQRRQHIMDGRMAKLVRECTTPYTA